MLRVPLLIPKSNNQCDLRITAAHCMSTYMYPSQRNRNASNKITRASTSCCVRWEYLPPSFLVSSVWQSMFLCAQISQIPLFNLLRSVVGWSWQMLDCLLILFSAAMSQTPLCLFSLSRGFFVGATSLVLQQFLLFLHVLHKRSLLAVARFDWWLTL